MPQPTPLVEDWFGAAFSLLHPQLQALHRQGGVLRGPCRVAYGAGMAGVMGKLLARRLGMAGARGEAMLTVSIASDASGLLWSRRLNDGPAFVSHFEPVGHYPDGHWLERSGTMALRLGVALREGGWHWEQRTLRWCGVKLPARMMPRTVASKAIVDGKYVFSVVIHVPLLGPVLSYRGALSLQP